MNLHLTQEQELLRDTFAQLFSNESSPQRVRAAEPTGFDAVLWKALVDTGAVGMRVPEARGGAGSSLLDVALVAEQAGRYLASGPLLESIVACSVLARFATGPASDALDRALDGSALVTLALLPVSENGTQLVPGGAAADAALALDGDELVLIARGEPTEALPNLGSGSVASWALRGGTGERSVLARGRDAVDAYSAAREEWKLLMAAALCGLAQRAVEIAAEYATERVQFDRPIGSFQAIAHPLANDMTNIEGGRTLVWWAIWALSIGNHEAGALIPMSLAWAAETTTVAVAHALHTFGGYGLSLEYDIQLYLRRGKAWALLGGDPRDEYLEVAARLWDGEAPALPGAGDIEMDFSLGEKAEAFRRQVREFLEEHLTDELRAHAHFSWDGHHPGFQRQLAEANMLFPMWPKKYGGQDRDPYEASMLEEELRRVGWGMHAIMTTRMVAETLMEFAREDLKLEVLNEIARGDAICSLGYSEPAAGSDVAAAQTRAVKDGGDWVINGQKMFTSGANLSDYVFLLTRTDPDAHKHKGLTMFLVPLNTPGIDIQPIFTISDERTNATYYTDVRVPDRYRIGDVDGGWAVLGHALGLEHGGSGGEGHYGDMREMVEAGVAWARQTERRGRPVFDDPRVRERLARGITQAQVSRGLQKRGFWASVEGQPDTGLGPMAALHASESFIELSTDLLDLAAPDSILMKGVPGAPGDGSIEFGYRHSTATTIYGGSSEILRSIIAQFTLRMPRSRS